jgi:hypothetical protein
MHAEFWEGRVVPALVPQVDNPGDKQLTWNNGTRNTGTL